MLKKALTLFYAATLISSLVACSGNNSELSENNSTTSSASQSSIDTATPNQPNEDFASFETDAFNYNDLANITFVYSSGAGGWSTDVEIQSDGVFIGQYHDSDIDTGPDYPNGTCYVCNFSGKFSSLTKIGENGYSMKCESLTQEGISGEEKIIDGIKYINAEPFGFENADEFRLFMVGTPIDELPESVVQWLGLYWDESEEMPKLDYIILYNVEGQEAFGGMDNTDDHWFDINWDTPHPAIIGDWKISYAINNETGEEEPLQNNYGSGISYGGTLSMNQDGTFSKYIGITNDDSDSYEGVYSISDNAITLEYRNGTIEYADYIPDSDSIQLQNKDSSDTVIYEYFVRGE